MNHENMAQAQSRGTTTGSEDFSSENFFQRWADGEITAPNSTNQLDFHTSIKHAFGLPGDDAFVYHAIASVTLDQVQLAIDHGAKHGLHAWYLNEQGKPINPPAQVDIDAYIAIFASTTSTSKALTSFDKNAKKGSLRGGVASYLAQKRFIVTPIAIPKLKRAHVNPYLDFWSWSCKNLEWCGPDANTVNVKHSHHVLPIFYHHFGCVCPSFDSLEFIKHVSAGRAIIDAGSGNGYWTYIMRRLGLEVLAIDNGDSIWRTMWVDDTINMDAIAYLHAHNGGKHAVLLLVYPQVSTDFTKSVLSSYKGSTICVAGTQNTNGFTAFADLKIDQYMHLNLPEFEKIVQIPLPSFPGKDEALFIFQRS